MKYLKLYTKFRLIGESSEWKKTIDINGKEYQINWGTPNFELAEIFQTLSHHKSLLPTDWKKSFGKIFDSEMPKEFNEQREPSKEYIDKPLQGNEKGKKNDVVTNYSSFELLQLESLSGKTGEDLVPYHNFIKETHKSFWDSGEKIQLNEEQLKQLAKNKASEPGDSDTGFHKVMLDDKFLDKLKIYYDIYIITDTNPNGIINANRIGKDQLIKEIKEKLLNMKEPSNPEHKKLWNELREYDKDPSKFNNPDWKDEKGEPLHSSYIIWSNLIKYQGYFGNSFDFFTSTIEKGGTMPLSAAVNMGGQIFLTGGNRRMTFYCGKKILPTIWIWKLN